MPFVAVAPFDELDDAIEKANDTEYGLTAGFFSEDRAEIDEWLDRIQAGVVYVNRRAGSTTGAWPGVQPFGGWKGSGTTGKAGGGPYYVLQYLREQSQDGDRGVSDRHGVADVELRGARGPRPDRNSITEVPGPEAMARSRARPPGHVSVVAARVPVRAATRGRLDRRGRRRQHLPGHERRHRRDLAPGTATRRGRGGPAAGDASCCTTPRSDFYLPIYSEVCERLDAMAPFGGARARSFLTNSGTEAVEAAIKLARYATGRQYLIGFYRSFHGRSMGVVSLTASKAKYRTRLRSHAAERVPLVLRGLRLPRAGALHAHGLADRGCGDRRGDRGSARAATAPARGLVHVPARALRPPRHPARRATRCSRAWAAAARCGRSSRKASRPTSSRRARASRAACRSGR